jgi:CAAX protease family protein
VATLTLAGVFYGYLRVWTQSVWPVAIAHAVFNSAWGILGDFTLAHSPDQFEYVGGESGVLVIAGLSVAGLVLARSKTSPGFSAASSALVRPMPLPAAP